MQKRRLSKKMNEKVFRDFDVISDRGGKSNHSVGNRYFRSLIQQRREEYKSKIFRYEKAGVSKSILDEIHRLGGRFWNHDDKDDKWNEMIDIDAIGKISQALRETRPLKWTKECRSQSE
jgi:hypothetical protein